MLFRETVAVYCDNDKEHRRAVDKMKHFFTLRYEERIAGWAVSVKGYVKKMATADSIMQNID
jgi:hypothetical protein